MSGRDVNDRDKRSRERRRRDRRGRDKRSRDRRGREKRERDRGELCRLQQKDNTLKYPCAVATSTVVLTKPGLPHLQISIACSMQKWREKVLNLTM